MAALQFYLDVLETLLGPLMLAVGAVVYAASPRSWANRSLAIFVFVEGLTFGGVANGVAGLVGGRFGTALFGTVVFSFALIPALYVWFTSAALSNALTRPFRHAAGQAMLALFAAGGIAYYFVARPSFLIALPFLLVTSLYAMSAAVWSVLQGTPPERRRAKAFLVAFILRDLAILGIVVGYAVGPGTDFQRHSSFWWSIVYAAFPFLVAHAVLQGQLVDLDHLIRLTLARSMAAAAVVATFFVATELAEEYVSKRLGFWVGVAAAAFLTLAGRQMQAAGLRLARVVVPLPDDNELFYAEQVAIALSDGEITPKDRRSLDNLARRLGLSAGQAARAEAPLRPPSAGPVPTASSGIPLPQR